MLAAYYTDGGPSSVIEVSEIDAPTPSNGEVRIRITVSGVNPTDWKARSRPQSFAPGEFQIPNQDGAGVIDAVGPGVEESRIGERVWIFFAAWDRPWGTAAQWTVVPEWQAVALPPTSSDALGATLGIPAMTAHRCLTSDGPIDGSTVLVSAGAGAVGRAAIQLASWMGARVVATASTDEKAQIALDAGADAVIRYQEGDAADQLREAAPEGVDRALEISLADNVMLDLASLNDHAVIVVYADDARTTLDLPIRRMLFSNVTVRFMVIYHTPRAALLAAATDLTAAINAGALSEPNFARFPLEQTAEAQDAVESGTVGKVLIDVP